jgi:hypothetical protein
MKFISSSSLRGAWGGSGEGERTLRGYDHTRETRQSFEDRTTHILPILPKAEVISGGAALENTDGSILLNTDGSVLNNTNGNNG